MKKKFSIVDLVIAIAFALFLSFYFLPQGINYFMNKAMPVPNSLKQEILLAGKKYLQNNNNNVVSLSELIDSGYLIKNSEFDDKSCFLLISTVSKNNNSYSLNLKCINDESKLSLLE